MVQVWVQFETKFLGERPHGEEWVQIEFYVADIQVDAILSHPWLLENKLGVFPHLKALAQGGSGMVLLTPQGSVDMSSQKGGRHRKRKHRRRGVNAISAYAKIVRNLKKPCWGWKK